MQAHLKDILTTCPGIFAWPNGDETIGGWVVAITDTWIAQEYCGVQAAPMQ